ncbi:MAG: tRNA (N6-threonylcarbamoyladenosine(37)-N6)-methyltransferase TrmO [Steroidobacteraceae bacterium]
MTSLNLEPIGFVRAPMASKAEVLRQPAAAARTAAGGASQGRIELLTDRNFEHALHDLAAWKYIWVIFQFHLNPGWRPKVQPPRSTTGRKGVFATRSPHRPNPLGLSAVRLEGIEGTTLRLGPHDMLDGTPVLDIKPYVAYTDSLSDAGSGWLVEDPVPDFDVRLEPLAEAQAAWIEMRTDLPIGQRIRSSLALGPEPHPYRRIRHDGDALQLAVKEWRVRFTVEGRAVRVMEIRSGYRQAQFAPNPSGAAAPDAHRQFITRFASR